jgi:hypothetical protein
MQDETLDLRAELIQVYNALSTAQKLLGESVINNAMLEEKYQKDMEERNSKIRSLILENKSLSNSEDIVKREWVRMQEEKGEE